MMDMLIQFAAKDINNVGGSDCLCSNCDCADIVRPIWIYWAVAALFLAVFVTGLIMRIRSKGDKKMIKRADIVMIIGFIGLVVLGLVVLWPPMLVESF